MFKIFFSECYLRHPWAYPCIQNVPHPCNSGIHRVVQGIYLDLLNTLIFLHFEYTMKLLKQQALFSTVLFQIRRVLKKRHTLPQYKIRYKPFCLGPDMRHPNTAKPADLKINGSKFSNGYLCVNVIECSRLVETPPNTMLYCTLAIGMYIVTFFFFFSYCE